MGRKKKDIPPLTKEQRQLVEELYVQFQGLMVHTAKKIASDPDEINDLIQDCYVNLMRNISAISALSRCEIAAYIVSSIRRTQIDRWRLQQKEACVISMEEMMPAQLDEQAASGHIPLDHDAKLDVMYLLEHISQKDKAILTWWYFEGCSAEELAEKLGCKPESIRTVISRLRQRAVKILEEGEAEGCHG